MRIFCKHIFRSIIRAPLQSLLIVLTLAIATSSFLVSAKSFIAIREDIQERAMVDNYASDITVKLSSRSDLRILFEDDIKDVVGDKGKVVGEFALDGLCNIEGVVGSARLYAVDFERADAFYKFKFTDYGRFTTENYKKSIIVSEEFASKNDLEVGDVFSFVLMDKTFDLTVQAIAVTEGAFHECSGVLSIDAVRDALALSNPVINSFAEGFTPYSQLRVSVNNKAEIDTVMELISTDERFADKMVIKDSEDVGNERFDVKISLIVMTVASALVVILSAIVVSSSLDLIRDKRSTETALFALCGAEKKHLNKIVYLEGVIYGAVGAIGGVLIARILYVYVNKTVHLGRNGIKNGVDDWIVALFASCFVTLISTLIHLYRNSRKTAYEMINETEHEHGNSIKGVVFASVAFAALLSVTFILPIMSRLIPSIATMFAFLILFSVAAPFILKLLAAFGVYALTKLKKIPPLAFMTFKNIHSTYPLRHTGRLVSILLVIISMIAFSVFSVKNQTEMLGRVFECDYVAIGADEECDSLVEREENVKDTFRISFFKNTRTEHGSALICISAEDDALSYINKDIGISRLPHSQQIFISLGVAKLFDAEVGDKINLYVEGQLCDFTVAEILDVSSHLVFIDARYVGYDNNMLAILMEGNDSEAEQMASLSAVLNPRGAGAIKFHDAVETIITGFAATIIAYLEFIVMIAIVTTAIGVINLILSQHNARRGEFFILYTAGLTKRKIFLLEVCEIFAVIMLAVLLAIPGGYVFSSTFDMALNSFGADFLH